MENLIDKRPLASTLRAMNIGDVEIFPISQIHTLRNYRYGAMAKERVQGWRFAITSDFKNGVAEVTRLS